MITQVHLKTFLTIYFSTKMRKKQKILRKTCIWSTSANIVKIIKASTSIYTNIVRNKKIDLNETFLRNNK